MNHVMPARCSRVLTIMRTPTVIPKTPVTTPASWRLIGKRPRNPRLQPWGGKGAAYVLRWFSTYCLTTSKVVPPTVATKYELVHSVGSRDRKEGNSWRSSRDDLPLIVLTRRWMPYCGSQVTSRCTWSGIVSSSMIGASFRVYQDSLGHWFASFVVRRDVEAAAEVEGSIGIDWGVPATATTTDPIYDLPYLGHRKRCAAERAKAQRKMSCRYRRGQTTSNGYKRAKREAANLHQKAANQNKHAGRLWAKAVVDNHQLIAVEDFKPVFLTKSTMARKSADAAIGAAKRELVERGTRAGRTVVMVPPAYTTMTCSECGVRAKQRLGLGERTFKCEHCGFSAGRDMNAARVI